MTDVACVQTAPISLMQERTVFTGADLEGGGGGGGGVVRGI